MYTLDEFMAAVDPSEGIVCYGIGKRFHMFLSEFEGTSIIEKIRFCIDAYAGNQSIKIENRLLEVQGLSSLQIVRDHHYVLIITNLRYDQVVDDLTDQGLLQGIQVFCFTHLYGMLLEERAMNKWVPANLRITKEQRIPKVIHYCWFGGNSIPDKYKKWMESWHKYCPDYEIVEWNESNYDVTKNAYMHEAYQCKKWGFVPDYARLDIIYNHGGIYMDTDVELVQNLDDLLYQEAYFGFERESTINLGLGFGAVKGSEIIRKLRDDDEMRHFLLQDGTMDLTASPVLQTAIFQQKGVALNGEYQVKQDFTIYPEKVLSGKCPYTRRVRLLSYTKSIHHYEATWTDHEFKERNRRFEQEMNS